MVTLNCGIQNGTVPLVALPVGVALGVVELDVVVVPDDAAAVLDDAVVVPEGAEVDPDGAEGNGVPLVEDDELPLLGVGETREPVLLAVNVEDPPELMLLGVADNDVVVLGIDNERLVSVLVLVVSRGVLVETEVREGLDALAELLVEVDRVDKDVTGEEAVVLPRLEESGFCVDVLEWLGRPLELEVESLPDETLLEEVVDVTSVEELCVPETADELVILLVAVVVCVRLSVVDVNDTEEDWPVVFVPERLLEPDDHSDDEPLTLLVVDEATELSVPDSVEAEVPDESEDVHEDTGTLGLSSVVVEEATGEDEESLVVLPEDVVEPLLIEPPVLGGILPDPEYPLPVWVVADTTGPVVVDVVVGSIVVVPPQS